MRLWHLCQFDPTQKPDSGAAEIDWTHPLADGLAACWTVNEGAGSSVADLAGISNGRLVNGPIWSATQGGVALQMVKASSQGVIIPATTSLNITSSITVETRFLLTATPTTNDVIAGRDYDGSANIPYLIDFPSSATGPRFIIFAASASHSATQPSVTTLNVWHSAIGTANGKTIQCYLDGGGVATTTDATLPPSKPTLGFGIGYMPALGRNLSGRISKVSVYARDLSADKVAWLHAEPYAMLRPVLPHRAYSFGSPFFFQRFVASRGRAA
jgi:hypothetical protein